MGKDFLYLSHEEE